MSMNVNLYSAGSVLDAGAAGSPDGLTPEALMIYLQTRLDSLDDQINGIFGKQKNIEAIRKALAKIENTLAGLEDDTGNKDAQGVEHGDGELADFEQEILDAIDEIEQVDPQLARTMRAELAKDAHVLHIRQGLYKTRQVVATREYIGNLNKQLESSAQIEMIRLQSIMSSRQTAVQLATNLVAGLEQGPRAIVSNIGK